MRHETKTFTARVKAAGGKNPTGKFEAIVSVFGNVDHGGDRMIPGAFAASLADWKAKGDPIPVIWSHDWENPESHIGWVDPQDAVETADGLLVKGQLDVDVNPRAKQVAYLMATRRVKEFSFGYVATDFEFVKDGTDTVRELRAVDLFEVGPTLKGMNPATQLLEAASALSRDGKAGVIMSKDSQELIRSAYDTLAELVAIVDGKNAQVKVGPNPENWVVGANLELQTSDSARAWDGAAAERRIFEWAGWTDNPNPELARQAFLLYDENNAEYKGAYHLPFADVVDGELLVFPAGIRAAASYLPRTDVPQSAIDAAREVIDHYEEILSMGAYADNGNDNGNGTDETMSKSTTDIVQPDVNQESGDTTPTINHERLAELFVLSKE